MRFSKPYTVITALALALSPLGGASEFDLPAKANPFDSNCDLSGDGSSANPFQISKEQHLLEMDFCKVGGTTHFKLTDDIRISEPLVEPRDYYFSDSTENVVFEGNNKGIYGLQIKSSVDGNRQGFFGEVADLTVRDTTIVYSGFIRDGENSGKAGLMAGETDNFTITNSFVEALVMVCESVSRCSGLVGEVDNDLTVDNVTVSIRSGVADDNFGGVSSFARGNVQVTELQLTTRFLPSLPMGYVGGVVGRMIGEELTLSDSYISLNNNGAIPANEVGGIVAVFSDAKAAIKVSGSTINLQFPINEAIGGAIGRLTSATESASRLDVSNSRFRTVAFVNEPTQTDTEVLGLGGVVGNLNDSDSRLDSLTMENVLLQMQIQEYSGDNTSAYQVDSVIEPAKVVSATYTNVLVDSDFINGSAIDATYNRNSDTGITERTGAQLNVKANIPFPNLVHHPGTVGTDKWEHCDDSGPYPVITPNPCGAGTVTLSTSSASANLGADLDSITDVASDTGISNVLKYSVRPSLPAGLFLNPRTGEIFGTVEQARGQEKFEITKYTAKNDPAFAVAPPDSDNWTQSTSRAKAVLDLNTKLPAPPEPTPTPEPEIIRDTVVIEKEVPAEYSGGLITSISKQVLSACTEESIEVIGQDLDKITKIKLGDAEINADSISPTSMTIGLPCLEKGKHDLTFESKSGDIVYRDLFEVLAMPADEMSEVQGLEQEQLVNAGSFKGYVAIYAKGYQGKRLSAKVGNDWVIEESLASDFERITDFTGAGVEISVRIFIDRNLVRTVELVTK